MNEQKNVPSGRKRGKPGRIALIVFFSLVALAIAAVIVVYAMTARLSSGAVPIVTVTGLSAAATPIPTPDLPIITGEPDDIGEDIADPTPAATEEPIYQQVPIAENAINILIVGQDIRPNQGGRGRSDTMMLLSYNRDNGTASMVSLMRDTWVPIEGHDWNRLNATYSFGGIGLTVNTINSLFHLDVQNYVIIDFQSMIELVDQIGGIDVNLTKVEADYYNKNFNWGVAAGKQHLNGEMALAHARNRKSNGGDFERTRRQQDVMLAIFDKLKQNRDPVALSKLLGFTLSKVETNMPPNRIFTLMLEALKNGNLSIQRGRVPADGTWKYARKDGRSVIVIDIKDNEDYLHKLIYENK